MADRELIAATLAAGILSGKPLWWSEDGAKIAVEFYHQVLSELSRAETRPPAGRTQPVTASPQPGGFQR